MSDRTLRIALLAAVAVLVGAVTGAALIGASPDSGQTSRTCTAATPERAREVSLLFTERYLQADSRSGVVGAGVGEVEGGVGLLVTVREGSPLVGGLPCFRGVPVRYLTSP